MRSGAVAAALSSDIMTLLKALERLGAVLLGTAPEGQRRSETVVGQGGRNETQITIADLPHLFRDEGDRIVHFVAAFDSRVTQTRFGPKLLPDVVPCWSKHDVTPDSTLEKVIAKTLAGTPAPSPAQSPAARQREHNDDMATQPTPSKASETPIAPKASARSTHRGRAASVGRLTFWGVMEFPKRDTVKPDSYKSFAVKIDTGAGTEKTLQGEGLKDAIAEAKCSLGDHVRVTRLEKVKVPAFHELTGKPLLDNDGNQKLWDKWLWRIDKTH